jgi:hypothetical protein
MNEQMKKDFANIQYLDWYVQGYRGNEPSGTFSDHVCKSLRHWIERMNEYPNPYGYFDTKPAVKMLRSHYLANPPKEPNCWMVYCMELEFANAHYPLRRLYHPKSETKIKAGDIVYLYSIGKIEKTIALRPADQLPKLGVEFPHLIPEDFKLNRCLDVCTTDYRITVTADRVAHALPNGFDDFPKLKNCTHISNETCEQLDQLFVEDKVKRKDQGLLAHESWNDYVGKELYTSPDFGNTGFSGKLIRFDDDNLYVEKNGTTEILTINRADAYGSWFLEDR